MWCKVVDTVGSIRCALFVLQQVIVIETFSVVMNCILCSYMYMTSTVWVT